MLWNSWGDGDSRHTARREGSMAPPLQAKVLLLGDSGVGKTCLRMRYIDNKFSQQFRTSIGLDFQFRATTALKGTPDQVDVNMQVIVSWILSLIEKA